MSTATRRQLVAALARHQSDLKRRELALRAIIQEAVRAWPQFDGEDVGGLYTAVKLVEWFPMWRRRAIEVLHDGPRGESHEL